MNTIVIEVDDRPAMTQADILRWHRWAKPLVHAFYRGRCTQCHCYVPLRYGVIHHRSYENGYPWLVAEVIFLCKQGRLEWNCYPCHDKAHRRRG